MKRGKLEISFNQWNEEKIKTWKVYNRKRGEDSSFNSFGYYFEKFEVLQETEYNASAVYKV